MNATRHEITIASASSISGQTRLTSAQIASLPSAEPATGHHSQMKTMLPSKVMEMQLAISNLMNADLIEAILRGEASRKA